MVNLRQRPKVSKSSTSSSNIGFGSRGNARNQDYDPSGKRRKKSPSWLPLGFVITMSGLLVFLVFNTFLSDGGDGERRSLRTALFGEGEGTPLDYSQLPLCIPNYEDMPELWRPPIVYEDDEDEEGTRLFMDHGGEPQSKDPWTDKETQAAQEALQRALDEILEYYKEEMSQEEIIDFQPDGLNSILDMAYSQKGPFFQQALMAARDMFILSATPFTSSEDSTTSEDEDNKGLAGDDDDDDDDATDTAEDADGNSDSNDNSSEGNEEEKEEVESDDETQADDDERRNLLQVMEKEPRREFGGCEDQYVKMKMMDYGHYIIEHIGRDKVRKHDPELQKAYDAVVAATREMIEICGTLDRILKFNITSELFEDPDEDSDLVFGYIMKAIALVELKTIPEIDLPLASTNAFIANLWKYLATYNLRYARDHDRHYWDSDTMDHAWLATHIAYFPSGYGRHINKVEDAPWLYKYIRDNFYYAMENGRIDLVSEFVDLIRTYGCKEENDYQLRDGTRYVMNQFYEEQDGQWIDYDVEDSNYNKIHNPWAGSAAVMLNGEDEPIVPGSYGYTFYSILKTQ